jgi:hypothetical protein
MLIKALRSGLLDGKVRVYPVDQMRAVLSSDAVTMSIAHQIGYSEYPVAHDRWSNLNLFDLIERDLIAPAVVAPGLVFAPASQVRNSFAV